MNTGISYVCPLFAALACLVGSAIAADSKENPRVNSLGMKFVPVPGTNVLFSVWETRVKDFRAFAEDTGHQNNPADGPMRTIRSLESDEAIRREALFSWKDPGFTQSEDHPVVGVSWADAQAFCQWLTKKDLAAGKLRAGQSYRLPTDVEWSRGAGLGPENGATPSERGNISFRDRNSFFWGKTLPPPPGAGNYAGRESKLGREPKDWEVIDGFSDQFPRTSPVGSFTANKFGLFDMSGNAAEICEDTFSDKTINRVARGASWATGFPYDLNLAQREAAAQPRDTIGFRCVLVNP